MPLQMFRLPPGGGIRYRVAIPGRPGLAHTLEVYRPREGPSVELELALCDADRHVLGRGRVATDGGYVGVLHEVGRQLGLALGVPADEARALDVELARLSDPPSDPPPEPGHARGAGG